MLGHLVVENASVSFDIFLQDFADEPSDRRDEVMRILGPLLDSDMSNLTTGDGSAAVYGFESSEVNGLMLNHVAGDEAWQVIFDTAVAADWVVMPVGGPVCIVSEDQRSSVPEDLEDGAIVLIRSGDELRAAATG
jgi:hypothetical protein